MAKGAQGAAGASPPWERPLTVAQREGLSALTAMAPRYGLSSETSKELLMLSLTMRLWPQDERAPRPLRQQQKSLEEIAAKADELEALIASLPWAERSRLFNAPLQLLDPWGLLVPDDEPDEPDNEAAACIGAFYPASYRAFVGATRQLSESFERNPKNGGRPPTMLWQLDLVGDIARLLRNKIKPSKSKGSRFMAICDACFAAVGIPAKAEGAVRVFVADLRAGTANRAP